MDRIEKKIRAEFLLPPEAQIPDVMEGAYTKTSDFAGIWVPNNPLDDLFSHTPLTYANLLRMSGWMAAAPSFWSSIEEKTEPCKPDSEEFEVNMMEALVGWRQWKVHPVKKYLMSQFDHDGSITTWKPHKALAAKCHKEQHAVPAEFCTCGIYAKDSMSELDYIGVYGEVYGWGRYVRGETGWRAQYAYPKSFYLTAEYARNVHPNTIDILKSYHVPIVMEQPVLFYSPEEEGYEHRKDEENWNIRTRPKSPADEDADPDYED